MVCAQPNRPGRFGVVYTDPEGFTRTYRCLTESKALAKVIRHLA